MPTLRGTSTASAVAPGAITLPLPSGTLMTDTVIVVAQTDHSAPTSCSAPDMAVAIAAENLATNPIQFEILVGTGLTGSVIVTPSDPAAWLEVCAMSWIDADSALIEGTPVYSDGDTPPTEMSGVTTVDPNTPVLCVLGQNFGQPVTTIPSSTLVTNVGGGGHARVYTFGEQAVAGPSGTVDVDWPSSGRSTAAVMFAVASNATPPEEPAVGGIRSEGGLLIGPGGGLVHASEAPPPAGDRFDVYGGHIRLPDGRVFFPQGFNASIKITEFPYVYENNATNEGTITSYEFDPVTWPSHVSEALAWNVNFVRVNCIVINDDPGGPNPENPALLADLIEHGVNELLAAGIVVMVTSHDFTGTENISILGTPEDVGVKEFYSACIAKWGTNPYFWINPYNEPYAWGAESLVVWHELFEAAVPFLRGEGYTGPIVCDIPRYAQGIDVLASGALDDFAASDPGIVFGWHAYGVVNEVLEDNDFAAHEAYAAAVAARGHCVLIGESGVANPPSAGDGPWQYNELGFEWCMDRCRAYGWGFAWWHSVHPTYMIRLDNTGFWHSTDGTGLTPSGELFWAFMHEG